MIRNNNFMLSSVAGNDILVPVAGEANYASVISLSGIGPFLWEKLEHDVSIDELVKNVLDKYDEVSEETARKDITLFLSKLKSFRCIIGD